MASHENRLYVVQTRTAFATVHKVFRTRKAARYFRKVQLARKSVLWSEIIPATWGPDNVGGKA